MSGRWSLDYVRGKYGVPVKRGIRVRDDRGQGGVVTCGDGAHVRVRLDGEKRSGSYHPLSLDYGDGITPEQRTAHQNARIDAWNDRLNGRISVDEYVERMSRPPAPVPSRPDERPK